MLVENPTSDASPQPTSEQTSFDSTDSKISPKLDPRNFQLLDGQARSLAEQVGKKEKGDGLIARRTIRVGRNDPCPNHKDVKFKNCECYRKIKTRILVPYGVARQMQGAKPR